MLRWHNGVKNHEIWTFKVNFNKSDNDVRNHFKLIHVVTSCRGFSKGTVLCGGY